MNWKNGNIPIYVCKFCKQEFQHKNVAKLHVYKEHDKELFDLKYKDVYDHINYEWVKKPIRDPTLRRTK